MSRLLASNQSPHRYGAALHRVDLIQLTTYTDREAETVDTVFSFSRDPTLYDYGNTGTDVEFWPVLRSVGPLDVAINHLPSQDDSELLRKTLSFTLNNIDWQGSRLIDVLRNGHVLENATVEWTQLLLAERPTTPRIDLTALRGDDQTFWYRGAVRRVGPITNDSIAFDCETVVPNPIVLKALNQSLNDPKDFGKRLPDVYGQAKRVRAIGYTVGWVTTLAEAITDTTTGNTDFTNLDGVNATNNDFRIGNENIRVDKVSQTVGNITDRGFDGTTASAHAASEVAVEQIFQSEFVVAGHAVSAINNVFIRNPFNGEMTLITTGFTKDTSNTTLISGETVATITFTESQYASLIENLALGATTQPALSGGGGSDTQIQTVDVPATAMSTITHGLADGTNVFLAGVTDAPAIGSSTISTKLWIRHKWPAGAGLDSTHNIARWRVKAVYNAISGNSSGDPDIRMRWRIANLFGLGGVAIQVDKTGHDNLEVGTGKVGSWFTPSGTNHLSDLEGSTARIDLELVEINGGLGWDSFTQAVFPRFTGIQAELEFDITIDPPTLSGEVEFLSSNMGNGVEIWADVDGHLAPTVLPEYKAGDGNLIEKPCDVMRHMIEGPNPSSLSLGITTLEVDNFFTTHTSHSSGSFTPSADMTIICVISSHIFGANFITKTPTLTGNGLTWTMQATARNNDDFDAANRDQTLFSAHGSSPSTGAVTVDFDGEVRQALSWTIYEFPDSGPDVNDGIVQSVAQHVELGVNDDFTITIPPFSDARNMTFVTFGTSAGSLGTKSIETGFTLLDSLDSSTSFHQFTGFKGSPDLSITGSNPRDPAAQSWVGIGIEVQLSGLIEAAAIDHSTYDECSTNLDDNVLAFDSRTLGLTWEEKLARVAFESRTTLVSEEFSGGTSWKMLTALSTYAFPAAAFGPVTEWDKGGFAEADQDVRFVHASRFTFPYSPDWSKGADESAFTQLVIANEDTNDLTTPSVADFVQAAKDVGSFEADPISFKCIQQLATAEEIAGYYAHERIRIPVALFAVSGVPWWEGYDLEVGDIINVTPPWATGAVKARIIEYTKDPSSEQIDLRLVEVQ